MLLQPELRVHAPHSLVATPERYGDQHAGGIVGPLMIGADEPLRVAARLATEDNSAVGAVVGEHADAAVAVARHHHRLVADIGADEIVWVRNLGFEGYVRPIRTAENAFLLAVVDVLIAVNPKRNASGSFCRPRSVLQLADRVHGTPLWSVRQPVVECSLTARMAKAFGLRGTSG